MKCDHCPVASLQCPGEDAAILCRHARERPGYGAILNEHAAQMVASRREYPLIATQLGNALVAAARFVASGFATVDRAEQARRREICEACEHFDAGPQRCRQCGCAVAVKAWMKAERCPLDPPKWSAVEPPGAKPAE